MMHNIDFSHTAPLQSILVCGAHCDDIEIGCGGTILRLLNEYPNCFVHWVVFSSSEVRKKEALAAAESFLQNTPNRNIIVKDFRNGFFPYIGEGIKEFFEDLKTQMNPDVVFTHYRQDLHQDHRTIAELTWNTFRNHFILEYEIMKYDGDLGNPNLYVTLSEEVCSQKINIIMNAFVSQKSKHWFTASTFRSLLRLRGVESGAESGFSEAFYARKLVY